MREYILMYNLLGLNHSGVTFLPRGRSVELSHNYLNSPEKYLNLCDNSMLMPRGKNCTYPLTKTETDL